MMNPIRSTANSHVPRLVAAAPALAAVLALMHGPAAQAAPLTTFVSNQYGYAMVLPDGSARYLTTHASTNWSGGGPFPSDPAFDQINDLKTHSLYMVAAKRIPPGWTLRKWTSFTISITVPPCHRQHTPTTSKLGGTPALAYDLKCAEGLVFQLAAVHAHRGYLFIYTADTPDRSAFNTALGTFHFLGK
jgi:hypothetical protein